MGRGDGRGGTYGSNAWICTGGEAVGRGRLVWMLLKGQVDSNLGQLRVAKPRTAIGSGLMDDRYTREVLRIVR